MTNERSDGSKSLVCHDCFKRVPQLFEVSPEDEMRTHSGGAKVCARCLNRIRSGAHLVSSYSWTRTITEIILLTPLFYLGIGLMLYLVSEVSMMRAVGTLTIGFFVEALVFLTGGNVVLKWLRWRYAFTHNLLWSLKTRPVVLGLATMIAVVLVVFYPI